MSKVFDLSELESYGRDMRLVAEKAPKRQKQFLQKEGTKLRTRTKARARKIGKKTGNYLKSIKRGKVYDYHGDQAIRVYSYAPHAHLIENGHRMVTHDGREVGFVKGHHVFELAAEDFEPEYYTDLDEMLDEEVVEKL